MSHTYLYMYADTRYLCLLIRFNVLLPSPGVFNSPRFSAKADAKIQPFSIPPKYFFKKNYTAVGKALSDRVLRTKKNFRIPPFPPPQNDTKGQFPTGKSEKTRTVLHFFFFSGIFRYESAI